MTAIAVVLASPAAAADAVRDRQWHLDYLGISQAHQITRGGGTAVAVIDSRADINHPDLADNALPGRDFISDFGEGLYRSHAIEVASVLAGHGHGPGNRDGVLGIAPEAKIRPIRANVDPLSVADAVLWAVDQGVAVINLSWGLDVNEVDLEEAIGYAQAHDVVVVASAGNTTDDEEEHYPALYPGVVAVSATNNSGRLSDISISGNHVDLAAPGDDIMTAKLGGGYQASTGTSFAAPVVAGTAALIRARYPEMNAASVVNRLVKTADDKGPKGKDPQYGHGIVNPVRALTTDIPDVQQNPLGSLAKPSPTATAQPGAGGTDDGGGGLNPSRLLTWVLGIVIVGGLIALIVWLTRRRPGQARTSRPPPGSPSPHGPPPHGPPPGYPPPQAGPPGGQPYGHGPPPGPPPNPPPQGPPPGWQPPPGRSPPR